VKTVAYIAAYNFVTCVVPESSCSDILYIGLVPILLLQCLHFCFVSVIVQWTRPISTCW